MNGKAIKVTLNDTLDDFEDRDYLGMSAIAKCMRFLYDGLVHGRAAPSPKSLRYCHEGYLHEHDVIERLVNAGMKVENRQRELVAPFDGRFRGHIDAEIEGTLIEIKSVNDDRFAQVMDDGPFGEHLDQVQMYMRYGGYAHAVIVYKSRDTGDIWTEDVTMDDERGVILEEKAKAVLAMVDRGERPACTCGYCR